MNDWQTTRFRIDLSRPRVMGIVNVTPDSFSDGGVHGEAAQAIRHCEELVREGADILDVGGESSRPGAQPVPLEEELRRVLPVLRVAVTLGVPVSIDTYKTEVMQQALDLGADIVNDIFALRSPGAQALVADHGRCGVCLMHMQGEPKSMQWAPQYGDVVAEVREFLAGRAAALRGDGVAAARIVLDPGIGFGKSVDHNYALMLGQGKLLELGHPLLVGWSRKSALGVVTGRDVTQRQAASLAAALASVQHGARVVRVHDVAATVDVLNVWRKSGFLA